MTTADKEKIRTGIRWFLGVLLLWAAVSKLANPTEFLASIYAYELPLPRGLMQFTAVVLPWIELLCGLLLLANFWTESAVAAAGLMGVFVMATGQAWARGLEISCGCFDLTIFGLQGSYPGLVQFLESPGFAFVRNLVLLGLIGFLLWKRIGEIQATVAAVPAHPPARHKKHGAHAGA
jgi:putative oxidoreductase